MTPSAITCAYCQKHRWCSQCKKGYVEGERCPDCAIELQPAPKKHMLPPAQPGQQPQAEVLHDECVGVVVILRSYQGLFFAFHGHAMEPLDRAFRFVTKTGFKGWLDIKISAQGQKGVFESYTRIITSHQNAKEIPGFIRFPINPDLVELIHKSTAAKADDVSDHDMAAQQKQINETREDLS